MNCKPGDLAVYVRSSAGNEGRIVEVVRPLGINPVWGGHRWVARDTSNFFWLVRSQGTPLRDTVGRFFDECPAADSYLRPIRPGDLEDETPTVRELEAA